MNFVIGIVLAIIAVFARTALMRWVWSLQPAKPSPVLPPGMCQACRRMDAAVEHRRHWHFYTCGCGRKWKVSKKLNLRMEIALPSGSSLEKFSRVDRHR